MKNLPIIIILTIATGILIAGIIATLEIVKFNPNIFWI